jgi:hypothetical protein
MFQASKFRVASKVGSQFNCSDRDLKFQIAILISDPDQLLICKSRVQIRIALRSCFLIDIAIQISDRDPNIGSQNVG